MANFIVSLPALENKCALSKLCFHLYSRLLVHISNLNHDHNGLKLQNAFLRCCSNSLHKYLSGAVQS